MAMSLVMMDVAQSHEVIDSVLSFVFVMLLVMKFKHFPGIVGR
jgi:hypothetical protein